jgi:hypothetical protein
MNLEIIVMWVLALLLNLILTQQDIKTHLIKQYTNNKINLFSHLIFNNSHQLHNSQLLI